MSASSPSLYIAAQFVTDSSFVAIERPYVNKEQVTLSFETRVEAKKLPEDNTWRVEMDVTLEGTAKESGAPLFSAVVSQEFIVVVQGASEDLLSRTLRLQVPSRMFAHARARIQGLSQDTGYGPLTLPPVTDAYIESAYRATPEQPA